jgi:3',5'-cyclic AMP phosphodiesterase CpdA
VKLFGLSDLHVNHAANRETLAAIPAHPEDWLILGGDLGESLEHLDFVLDLLAPKWAKILWVPGNHELWTTRDGLAGQAKYDALVARCRARGVVTPEDPYPVWPGDASIRLCPLFLLYDYSFCPPGMRPAEAVAWAKDDGIQCADEIYLRPDPHPSREAWCHARVAATEARLEALDPAERTVLISHWPLRLDVVRLYRIPRFIPWCGTTRTHDWHLRFRAVAAVSGHLHMRATDWRDGVRFEEISLGYPRHWRAETGATGYLREILPGPADPPPIGHAGPVWHR